MEQKRSEGWYNFTFWITTNAEWLSPVLNLATIGVAGWLLLATLKQVEISAKQLELSRESSEKQLRAYVTLHIDDDSLQERIHRMGSNFNLPYIVKNVGNTPAYNFKPNIRWTEKDSVVASDFDFIKRRGLPPPHSSKPGCGVLRLITF